jgi:hypothetical protein
MKRHREDSLDSRTDSRNTRLREDSPDNGMDSRDATEDSSTSPRHTYQKGSVMRPKPVTVYMGSKSSASSAPKATMNPRIKAKAMPQPSGDHRPPLQRTTKKGTAEASSADRGQTQSGESSIASSRWIEVVNLPTFASNNRPWSARFLELCNPSFAKLPDFEEDSDSEPVINCWTRPRSSRGIFTHTLVVELQNCALACSAARVLDGLRYLDKLVEARVIDPP